jgi:hypothetical protein
VINQQGFKQEDGLKGFDVMNQQSPDEVSSRGVGDSHSKFKGEEIRQKDNLVQDLARKCNHIQEPSYRGFDGRLQD